MMNYSSPQRSSRGFIAIFFSAILVMLLASAALG